MNDGYRSKECVGVEFYKAEKAETTKKTPAGTVKESLMVLQQSQLDFCQRLSVFVFVSLSLSNIVLSHTMMHTIKKGILGVELRGK